MCTAISQKELFGRTLDLEYSYGEEVVVTPRNYRFDFIYGDTAISHYAMIGVAHVVGEVPLYYDAINETGLGAAALNFPGCAVYCPCKAEKRNIASYELIPWLLCRCDSVDFAEKLLREVNITQDSFSEELQTTPLHWMISDKDRAITVESTSDGLNIYDNPVGVMTNSPIFPYHMNKTAEYMHLNSDPPRNTIAPTVKLSQYSRGMGAIGLPGDYSSSSRFVRAVFAKNHTVESASDENSISRFFHIMDTLAVPIGCIKTDEGKSVRTVYTSCGDLDSRNYYFTTYGCRRITGVRMYDFALDGKNLIKIKMNGCEDVLWKTKK